MLGILQSIACIDESFIDTQKILFERISKLKLLDSRFALEEWCDDDSLNSI